MLETANQTQSWAIFPHLPRVGAHNDLLSIDPPPKPRGPSPSVASPGDPPVLSDPASIDAAAKLDRARAGSGALSPGCDDSFTRELADKSLGCILPAHSLLVFPPLYGSSKGTTTITGFVLPLHRRGVRTRAHLGFYNRLSPFLHKIGILSPSSLKEPNSHDNRACCVQPLSQLTPRPRTVTTHRSMPSQGEVIPTYIRGKPSTRKPTARILPTRLPPPHKHPRLLPPHSHFLPPSSHTLLACPAIFAPWSPISAARRSSILYIRSASRRQTDTRACA